MHPCNCYAVGSHHFGKKVCNLLCCIFGIGPILLVVGTWLGVHYFTNSREAHIINYNNDVVAWVSPDDGFSNYANTYRLSASHLAMRFVDLNSSVQLLPMITPESFFNDDDDSIALYGDYIRFENVFTLDVSSRCSIGPPWNGCDVSNFLAFDLRLNGALLKHFDVPAFTRVSTQYHSESDCPDGQYWDNVNQNCYSYSIITSLCVKLANVTGWDVDYFQGPGCGEKTWEVAAYEPIQISKSSLPSVISVDLSARSSLDPKVQFYMEMGVGATDFGPSLGLGFGLAIGASVLGIISVLCCIGTGAKLLLLNTSRRSYVEVDNGPSQQGFLHQPVAVGFQPAYGQPYPPNQQPSHYQPPYPQQGYQ